MAPGSDACGRLIRFSTLEAEYDPHPNPLPEGEGAGRVLSATAILVCELVDAGTWPRGAEWHY